MVRAEIIKAELRHIPHIVSNIRPEDEQELWDSYVLFPKEALEGSYANSSQAWTGTVDGLPICMFGIAGGGTSKIGHPWLIGTRAIDQHATRFLRLNREFFPVMIKGFDRLENYVAATNGKAIEWLKWLGFTFGNPEPYGPFKKLFIKFWMDKN